MGGPEINNQPAEQHNRVKLTVEAAGLLTAGGVIGAAGATASTFVKPLHVTFAPGIEADVSPTLNQQGTDVSTDFGSLYLPHVPSGPTGGAHIKISSLDIAFNNPASMGKYTALVTQPKTAVSDPIRDALKLRIAEGGLSGMALVAAAGFVAIQRRRRQRAVNRHLDNLKSTATVETAPDLLELEKHLRGRRTPRKLVAGLVGAALSLGGCGGVALIESNSQAKSESLDAAVTSSSPYLQGARVSGSGANLLAKAADELVSSVNKVTAYWQYEDAGLQTELQAFTKRGGLAYLKDPTVLPVLDISGITCNQAYQNTVYKTLLRHLKPAVILNSGDIFTNDNSMPYEKICLTNLQKTNGRTPMIWSRGNHDPKKSLPEELSPRNHYTAAIKDGKRVVNYVIGRPDPMYSTLGPTQPPTKEAQNKALARMGQETARQACEVYGKTGKRPIVLVHQAEMGFASLEEGCATVVNSGHSNYDNPIWPLFKGYQTTSNRDSYQYVSISASGFDGGVPLYLQPKRNAGAALQIYDNKTGELKSAISIVINASTGAVKITPLELPSAQTISFTIDEFLNQYAQRTGKDQKVAETHQAKTN